MPVTAAESSGVMIAVIAAGTGERHQRQVHGHEDVAEMENVKQEGQQ